MSHSGKEECRWWTKERGVDDVHNALVNVDDLRQLFVSEILILMLWRSHDNEATEMLRRLSPLSVRKTHWILSSYSSYDTLWQIASLMDHFLWLNHIILFTMKV